MENGRDADREGPDGAVRISVRVFISYAHDESAHEDRVRDFWWFLREQGVDARVDLPAAEHRQDWTEWMTQQIRDADYVLVIASPEYKRRAEGQAPPDGGRGVQWEARLIRDRFYADQQAGLRSIVPVVLPGCSASGIPPWMGPVATTYYLVHDYTVTGAEKLLRLLTGQPTEIEPPLGKPPAGGQKTRAAAYLAPPAVRRRIRRPGVGGRRCRPRPWTPAGNKLTTLLTSPSMVNFEEQNGYRTSNDNGDFVSYMAIKHITVPNLNSVVPQFMKPPTEFSLSKLVNFVVAGPSAC